MNMFGLKDFKERALKEGRDIRFAVWSMVPFYVDKESAYGVLIGKEDGRPSFLVWGDPAGLREIRDRVRELRESFREKLRSNLWSEADVKLMELEYSRKKSATILEIARKYAWSVPGGADFTKIKLVEAGRDGNVTVYEELPVLSEREHTLLSHILQTVRLPSVHGFGLQVEDIYTGVVGKNLEVSESIWSVLSEEERKVFSRALQIAELYSDYISAAHPTDAEVEVLLSIEREIKLLKHGYEAYPEAVVREASKEPPSTGPEEGREPEPPDEEEDMEPEM